MYESNLCAKLKKLWGPERLKPDGSGNGWNVNGSENIGQTKQYMELGMVTLGMDGKQKTPHGLALTYPQIIPQ